MTDYLLVHGAGQGAWSWGKVWGYMTAPETHPPRLYARTKVGKVFPLDLPGHGVDSDGDTASVMLEECVHSIVRTVERQSMRDVVLVGHGLGGALILLAAAQLPAPPKRLVLLSGIAPAAGAPILSEITPALRVAVSGLKVWSAVMGQELKLPGQAVTRYLCNGMDPMTVVQMIGFMGPLPAQVIKSRMPEYSEISCPVTYVVLTGSRVVSPASQRRIAGRIPNAEVLEMPACHQVTHHRPRELADLLMTYA